MIAAAPNFEVLAVERDVPIDAARIRALRGSVRLLKAVHIASASRPKSSHYISGNRLGGER